MPPPLPIFSRRRRGDRGRARWHHRRGDDNNNNNIVGLSKKHTRAREF